MIGITNHLPAMVIGIAIGAWLVFLRIRTISDMRRLDRAIILGLVQMVLAMIFFGLRLAIGGQVLHRISYIFLLPSNILPREINILRYDIFTVNGLFWASVFYLFFSRKTIEVLNRLQPRSKVRAEEESVK